MDHSVDAASAPPIPQDLAKKIPDLKREFGDLFLFPAGDLLIAYRPMTLGEFIEYRDAAAQDEWLAEDVALRTIVWPSNALELIDDMDIGVAAGLIQAIAKSSTIETFEELKSQMEDARNWAKTAEAAMIAWVCAAFPRYTVDDCYKMTQRKLVKLAAMAEKILGKSLEFEVEKKDKKPKAFGMAAPSSLLPERRASEAMLQMQHPEPRRAQASTPPPGSATPVFDFEKENRALGF